MTVRIGLIAASNIATEAIVEPARGIDGVEVVSVASRSPDRASQAASEWGLPGWHSSYDELLADPSIDAAYVATPAALHRKWAIAGLAAGKHVLIEKPLAANAGDARLILEASEESDLVAMEAFHWRYHPLVQQMRDVLDSGELGEIEEVSAEFLLDEGKIPRNDIRWQLELGGGALMDLGIYPAGWVWWVMGERPTVVAARAVCPVEGVDGRFEADLFWDGGVTGSIVASMIEPGTVFDTGLVVTGSEGVMTVLNPLAPQRGSSITVDAGDDRRVMPVSPTATYHHQLIAFRDAIVTEEPFPTTIEAGWQMMGLLDDCYRAAGLSPRPSRAD